MVTSTMDNGKTTNFVVKVPTLKRITLPIQAHSKTENTTERVLWSTKMETSMKGTSKKVKSMEQASTHGQMVIIMMVNGRTIRLKDMEPR